LNAAGKAAGTTSSAEFVPAISANGRPVAFNSLATALVTGVSSPANPVNVFARDLQANVTSLVSVNRAGNAAGNGNAFPRLAISDDGRYVAFASRATYRLASSISPAVITFRRDMGAGVTALVSPNPSGSNWRHGASGYG